MTLGGTSEPEVELGVNIRISKTKSNTSIMENWRLSGEAETSTNPTMSSPNRRLTDPDAIIDTGLLQWHCTTRVEIHSENCRRSDTLLHGHRWGRSYGLDMWWKRRKLWQTPSCMVTYVEGKLRGRPARHCTWLDDVGREQGWNMERARWSWACMEKLVKHFATTVYWIRNSRRKSNEV